VSPSPFDSLRIRPGEPGDHARVSKDWRLSAAKSRFAQFCTPRPSWGLKASQLYHRWQGDIMRQLLERAELWIACWAEAPSSVVGWAVIEPGARVVHYVDVLPKFRRNGVAKKLLAPCFEHRDVSFTYHVPSLEKLPVPPGWTYDPRPALLVPRPSTEKAA
jgi:GNAT superfamily N-acetyltransferase